MWSWWAPFGTRQLQSAGVRIQVINKPAILCHCPTSLTLLRDSVRKLIEVLPWWCMEHGIALLHLLQLLLDKRLYTGGGSVHFQSKFSKGALLVLTPKGQYPFLPLHPLHACLCTNFSLVSLNSCSQTLCHGNRYGRRVDESIVGPSSLKSMRPGCYTRMEVLSISKNPLGQSPIF